MIIVFILGYVLIGILIQLLVRIFLREETLKYGYIAYNDILNKNIDDKDELYQDIMSGMSDEEENDFNIVMYDKRYLLINILGWPLNICAILLYYVRLIRILKRK